MRTAIISLSLLALVGCTAIPADPPPSWQARSNHYLLSGRQGWMPGRHLRFGPYQVSVDTKAPFNLLDDVLLKSRHQSVTIDLTDNAGDSARLHYEQRCDGHHGDLTIVEPHKFAAHIEAQGLLATFNDPYNLTLNGQHYHLDYALNAQPKVISISLNRRGFAELHLGVFDGSFSVKDHVWLVNDLAKSDAVIGALLVGYAVTFRPDYCNESVNQ
ncbi:hypothetical protein [Celerinatantimonas sp. MCCC 1A17872]|uniref:hypothetical protein n=1 Tax=Celerinatantimonas sp. MCCC 1A17872 TaxID=3177514 RepID=UPI0038C86EB5